MLGYLQSELKQEIYYPLFCFNMSYNKFSGIPEKGWFKDNGVIQTYFSDDILLCGRLYTTQRIAFFLCVKPLNKPCFSYIYARDTKPKSARKAADKNKINEQCYL
jgi:hypothetical protein